MCVCVLCVCVCIVRVCVYNSAAHAHVSTVVITYLAAQCVACVGMVASHFTTQLTCFTSTTVQMLTPEELLLQAAAIVKGPLRWTDALSVVAPYTLRSTLLDLLVVWYK